MRGGNKIQSKLKKLLLILFLLSTISFAQTLDSLELIESSATKDFSSTRFYKQLSTYNLNSGFSLSKSFERLKIKVNENFNSTFVRSTEKSIRDEQLLNLQTEYQFYPEVSLGAGLNSSIFSDNRRIEINQASSNEAFVFSKIIPYDKIYVAPFFGYMNNKQVLNDDNGLLYGAEALLNQMKFPDLVISSNLKFRNEDISPRKNTIRHYSLLLNSEFANDVSNLLNGFYSQNRKDFYFEPDSITSREFNITNNIQSRTETNYLLQDRLQYKNLFNLFSLDMTGTVNWRKIERDTKYKSLQNATSSIFDTEINELKLDFESIVGYQSKNFNGLLRILYSERDEKNLVKRLSSVSENLYENRSEQEARKNNNSIRASLSFLGNWKLSRSDQLYFSIFHNKLKYDTPSELNFDDRDELLSIIRLRYTKQFTPYFQGFINTEGTYNQTVYIFSEKSSNNNINRILRLAAGGTYSGSKFTSMNSFEVSANYTVYDFQDLNPNIRSYSFRQFTALDSTNFSFNKRLKFTLYGYLKLSEQGDLKWDDFKSRPTRYLKEIYCEPRFTVNYNFAQFSVGLRYFSLATFNYMSNVKFLDSDFRSIGPIVEMLLLNSSSLFVRIYGWYEFISVNSTAQKEQTNLTVDMTWSF